MAPTDNEPDLTELTQMEANAAAAAPVGSPEAAVSAFDSKPAPAGSPLPLMLAAGLCAIVHLIGPGSTLAEKLHFGRYLIRPVDRFSPALWERLIHARMTAPIGTTLLALLEVALCIAAVVLARSRMRLAIQLFAAAAIINAADWYFLGFNLLHNPSLLDPEKRAAMTFTVCELALALLLWMRARSSRTA